MESKPSVQIRRQKIGIPVLILAAVLAFPAPAGADRTLRCAGRLVYIGDTRAEVKEVCGEPDEIERWQEAPGEHLSQIFDYKTQQYRLPKAIDGPIDMERWLYDFGPTRFKRYLLFQNGDLIRIESGEKGVN